MMMLKIINNLKVKLKNHTTAMGQFVQLRLFYSWGTERHPFLQKCRSPNILAANDFYDGFSLLYDWYGWGCQFSLQVFDFEAGSLMISR